MGHLTHRDSQVEAQSQLEKDPVAKDYRALFILGVLRTWIGFHLVSASPGRLRSFSQGRRANMAYHEKS